MRVAVNLSCTYLTAICRYQLVPQPEPPRAPGQEGNQAQSETQTESQAASQSGRPQPMRRESNPASPSLPRSPPITEGSSMPGSFPFGNIFSALGNLVSGNSGNSDGNANNRGNTGARSSGDTNNLASIDERHEGDTQGNQQAQTQQGARQEQQGQPDLDLDLD